MYSECLFEPGDWIEIRAITNRGLVKKFWRTAQDLPSFVLELQRLNLQDFNIFVGPNPRSAEGLSGDANVATFRVLFTDFDGIEPGDGCGIWEFIEPRFEAAGLPVPDLTIYSGHGCHCYWRLTEAIEADQWRIVQKQLIATLGSDPACKNPERLLRLPGFTNRKFKTPTDCFILFAPEVAVCL
jgi:hypothetical protein